MTADLWARRCFGVKPSLEAADKTARELCEIQAPLATVQAS